MEDAVEGPSESLIANGLAVASALTDITVLNLVISLKK